MTHSAFEPRLKARYRAARNWLLVFQGALAVAILALFILFFTIINSSFGLVAIQNTLEPQDITPPGISLQDLPKDSLLQILVDYSSHGYVRFLEHQESFTERDRSSVYQLVQDRVVQPRIVAQWSLYQSVFQRADISSQVQQEYPAAQLSFRSWIDLDFITSTQSGQPEFAGIRTAILGSLGTIFIAIVFAFPIGVGAALYLEEFSHDNLVSRIIRTNINNLAGVPSIIYGILGLAVFVRLLEPITSGAFFGATSSATANGRTILSAGLTLGLLILPLIIINSREAILAVPQSLRHAGYGLGATKWQTIWAHVIPSSLPGILTGTILAISRAIGETAPMVVIGASTFITIDPTGPFSKFTTLPIQIYQWTARPQEIFHHLAAAAIIILLVLLLAMNATAILLRNRFSHD